MNFDSQWMKPDGVGDTGASQQMLGYSKQFQMELWQICSDSQLDSQCFYSVGKLTVKPWMLILR